MSTQDIAEIALDNGILAFDGRVVERFGFGLPGREPTRMHVREIEQVVLDGARLSIKGRGRSSMTAHLAFDEARRAEVETFLDRIRVAAAEHAASA